MGNPRIRVSKEMEELIEETQDSIKRKTGHPITSSQASAIIAKITKNVVINTKPTINITIRKPKRGKKKLYGNMDGFEI